MKFSKLIESLENYRQVSCLLDFPVKGISCNSKELADNFVFIAIKGIRQDGNIFIREAISRGAKAIVLEGRLSSKEGLEKINIIEVDDARKAAARLAVGFYGDPSQKIKVVGVTGTNGKTTTTYLIEAILKEAGFLTSVIGTVNYRFKDRAITSKNTTPGPIELQSLLSGMQKEGIAYTVMEVSSHALDQQRTAGVNFSSAVFTNLTQDHLDYHGNLENYFQAKAGLFFGLSRKAFAVINKDDPYGRKLLDAVKSRVITYGIESQADVSAGEINMDIRSSKFLLCVPAGKVGIDSGLIGRHNLYNILAAVSWAIGEGLELKKIKSALEKFSYVPGRLEKIDNRGGFTVFVDYAHTEDALRNVLKAIRQVCAKTIIVVFGCGGERDRLKRPKMGEAVSELADFAVITNDNPRSENPAEIISEIKSGIKKNNYCIIPDRLQAIQEALSRARPGDVVLIAGKGHENYQILNDRSIRFDDRQAARECLRSMNY